MGATITPDAARLKITLRDLDLAPWRVVDVPLSMTFSALHDTSQAAFLWFNCLLWGSTSTAGATAYRSRMMASALPIWAGKEPSAPRWRARRNCATAP